MWCGFSPALTAAIPGSLWAGLPARLIVRGDLLAGLPMVIADGYHRMCASYHLSENEDIPCRIIDRGVTEKLR